MGTSANDVDIGIGARDNGASQVADMLRQKFAALRQELAELAAQQEATNGGSTLGGMADGAAAATVAINQAIGAFVKLGASVDATNAKAVAAFREEGDAISSYLIKLGATDAELNKMGATIAKVEQRAGAVRIAPDVTQLDAATGKVQVFGRAADATFTTVPRGARTAANSLALLALSAESGTGSMTGMVRAAGGLAFGLSTLSSSANVVASAAGIGAIITIVGLMIELFEKGTEKTQQQTAALKAFTETNESFAARSVAVGKVFSDLSALPNSTAAQIQLIGISKAADDARKAVAGILDELRSSNAPLGFVGRLNPVNVALQDLRTRFAAGAVSAAQFGVELDRIKQAHPDFAPQIAQTAELAANYTAAAEALRKLTAAALQARAQEKDTRVTFGLTPDLAKELDEINQRFAALPKGALAVRSVEDEQKAVEKATAAWKQFVTTKEGSVFADITFAQARAQGNAKALAQLETARHIVETERTVAGASSLAESAKRASEAAAELETARTKGESAARRQSEDDRFADAKRALSLESGLAADRDKKLTAIEKEHAENILKINKEEGDKLTTLLQKIGDERLAADAKLADDEFGVRRVAAKRQFDANIKSITDLKLAGDQDLSARLAAEGAFTASLTDIERDRSARIEEIRIEAQQRIDAATNRTGEADPAKIRQGFKKQLDLLAATIASADTSDAEKAAARQGQRLIEQLIPIEVAKARMGELEKTLTAATRTDDTTITRTSALLAAHAITEGQARAAILAARIRERDIVQATLPLLQQEARNQPGNEDAQAKVEQYTTKLLELNITIAQTADEFFKLKETARSAGESAISGFLQGLTKLGAQDRSQINALSSEIGNARQELEQLLSIPVSQRTTETNNRITQVRQEVEATSVSLDNAKQSIQTWRDLFVSAVGSVADALAKTASEDLARNAIDILTGVGRKKATPAPTPSPEGDITSGAALELAAKNAATTLTAGGTASGTALETSAGVARTGLETAATAISASGEVLTRAADRLIEAAIQLAAARPDGGGDGAGFLGSLLNFGSGTAPTLSGGPTLAGSTGTALASLSPSVRVPSASLSRIPASAGGGGGGSAQTHVIDIRLPEGFFAQQVERTIDTPGGKLLVRVTQKNANAMKGALG